MNAVRLALRELYGLFVDDLGYALAIAAWIVLSLGLLRVLDPAARGPVRFGGFALILVASVRRATRTR